MNKKELLISENAVSKIVSINHKDEMQNYRRLRIEVIAGGCGGMQYSFKMDSTKGPEDQVFGRNGAEVVIDKLSLELISGGSLDYVEELIGSHFKISNPLAKTSCGCGASFSPF